MGARLTPWPAAVACPERPASARAAVPLRVIADQSQRLEPPQYRPILTRHRRSVGRPGLLIAEGIG